MHVLVTRPEADADGLRQSLEQRGHTVSLAPLLEMRPYTLDAAIARGTQATIATSRNALRALAGQSILSDLQTRPLYAVGHATGTLARDLGFVSVIEGPAGGHELARIIVANTNRTLGPLLYLTGNQVAFDVSEALEAKGYTCHKVTGYEMVEAASLPAPVLSGLASSQLDAVILMSPRTAQIFVRLVDAAGLPEVARNLNYLCLSNAVAKPLECLAPPSVAVAKMPNSEEILALIDQISSRSG
jgi:uroporphyrinogen-III synthase